MTRQRLLVLAPLLAAWVGMSVACGEGGAAVTKDNCDKVKDGMTVKQMEDILGSARDVDGNKMPAKGIAIAVWSNTTHYIAVTFNDGIVVDKVFKRRPTGGGTTS